MSVPMEVQVIPVREGTKKYTLIYVVDRTAGITDGVDPKTVTADVEQAVADLIDSGIGRGKDRVLASSVPVTYFANGMKCDKYTFDKNGQVITCPAPAGWPGVLATAKPAESTKPPTGKPTTGKPTAATTPARASRATTPASTASAVAMPLSAAVLPQVGGKGGKAQTAATPTAPAESGGKRGPNAWNKFQKAFRKKNPGATLADIKAAYNASKK